MPAINAYIVEHFGRDKFGQTSGTMSLVSGVASAASPVVGGWLWDNVSPKVPFVVTLVLAVVVGFIIWITMGETVAVQHAPESIS